ETKKIECPPQERWGLYGLLGSAKQIGGYRYRPERDSDGEQHLIEVARPIEPAIENAPERKPCRCRGDESYRQRCKKRPAKIVDQRRGQVAAEHGEGTMRKIDEIHQPERHGQANRQHEKQHAVSNAIEQDAEDGRQHGGALSLGLLAFLFPHSSPAAA